MFILLLVCNFWKYWDLVVVLFFYIVLGIVIYIYFGWVGLLLGFFIFYLISYVLGLYLFYVQYNFLDVIFKDKEGWIYILVVLEFFSYMKMS